MTNIEISSRINGGNKEFLREYLASKTQSIFTTAFRELQNRNDAMEAARSVLAEVKKRAADGTCPVDMDAWLEYLVTVSCNDIVMKKLLAANPDLTSSFASEEPAAVQAAQASVQPSPAQPAAAAALSPVPEIKNVSRESNEKCKKKDIERIKRNHRRDVAVTAILIIVTLLLAWVLLSLLYLKGIISMDFSFGLADWFNQNVLRLFLIGS